ncbi:DUF192 domain-containing protein [Myxococcota bacterium]|nr:DUF192 domain-containing protein [Myxococcota bacterium]
MQWARRSLAFLCFLMVCGCGAVDPLANPSKEEPEAWVSIGGTRIPVELAITKEEQRLGLGERDTLKWGHGMLFIHEEPDFRQYWMKGMRFDIDIIWIRDGRISSIAHRVPHVPGENGPRVRSSELVDQVLEVPAGYAQTQGWRRGQRVQIEGLDRKH